VPKTGLNLNSDCHRWTCRREYKVIKKAKSFIIHILHSFYATTYSYSIRDTYCGCWHLKKNLMLRYSYLEYFFGADVVPTHWHLVMIFPELLTDCISYINNFTFNSSHQYLFVIYWYMFSSLRPLEIFITLHSFCKKKEKVKFWGSCTSARNCSVYFFQIALQLICLIFVASFKRLNHFV
jgi:hypothetical protein